MKFNRSIFILFFAFALCIIPTKDLSAGGLVVSETDTQDNQLVGFFDLRERESFIQITNTATSIQTIHIQIFNVADNCNENNFFDAYSGNDTHVYNLRDMQTNDGNPSGVVLPPGAYGFLYAAYVAVDPIPRALIGNLRIEDNTGYEYRTNLLGIGIISVVSNNFYTFNFNSNNGVILSDIVGVTIDDNNVPDEALAANIVDVWVDVDVDLFNNNEVPFSCRDVVFSCVDEDNPLLEALLEESGVNVASFEYGINNAIPHSKGGELLCPGNTISDGIAKLFVEQFGNNTGIFVMFVGLNNGNGRGSMDGVWNQNDFTPFPGDEG